MAKVKEPATQLSVRNWFFYENCQLFKSFAKFNFFWNNWNWKLPANINFSGLSNAWIIFFQSAKTAPDFIFHGLPYPGFFFPQFYDGAEVVIIHKKMI